MPWKVTFNQDTELSGLGTVTAIFVDDNEIEISRYKRQVKTMIPEDCEAFSVEAKAVLQKDQENLVAKKASSDKITLSILTELNK